MTIVSPDMAAFARSVVPRVLAKCLTLQTRAALLPVLLALLVLAAPAHAVSLGDELVLSRLGDPVEVEIDVLQWQDINLDRVEIAAASRTEYAAFGLTYLTVLDNLSFNLIGPNANGRVRVLVSSRDAIQEPFLELLLVLRWPGGSLLREYVLLFDPPPSAVITGLNPATGVAPPAVLPAPVQNTPMAPLPDEGARAQQEPDGGVTGESARPIVESPAAITQPDSPNVRTQTAIEVETVAVTTAASTPPATGRRQYRVRDEDNLWDIARQFQPAGTGENLYQVLLSIHELNRSAFINGNISLLKADAILQIPGAGDISRVDPLTAEREFNQRWEAGTRGSVATVAGEALAIPGTGEPAVAAAEADVAIEPLVGAEIADPETSANPSPVSGLVAVADIAVVRPLQAGAEGAGIATPQVEAALVPARALVPGNDSTAASSAAASAPGTNPYLDRINASAESMERMLQSRSVQLAQLEQQVAAMRIRMDEARAIAATLNAALNTALENRAAREAAYRRNSMLLGAAFAVMFCGFAVAVMFALRLLRQLRMQRVLPMHQRAARLADFPDMEPGTSQDLPAIGI